MWGKTPLTLVARRGDLSLPLKGGGKPHPLDFPFERDARMREHAGADLVAERLDVGAGRVAGVDQEIGVFLADLRAAKPQPPAACRVDEGPSLLAGRVFEGRATGA